MRTKKKNTYDIVLSAIEILLAAAIVLLLVLSFANLETSDTISGREKLEEAVRRAAVSCYTEEGVYPPNMQYIVDNYGVIVDNSKYTVHYTIFAQNIMPDITVTEKRQ